RALPAGGLADLGATPGLSPRADGAGSRSPGFPRSAEREIKTGACIDLPLGPDSSAVPMDDALDGGEADPGARKVGRRVQALEGPEQLRGDARVVPGAVVTHEEGGFAVGVFRRAHFDGRLRAP